MTDQVNPTLQKIEDIFKSYVWDLILKAGLSALFVDVPVLGLPVIKQTIIFVVTTITDYFYKYLKLYVDFGAITFLNDAHEKAYETASLNLKLVAIDHGVDSDEFKAAREKAKDSLASFVHYNG